KLFLIPAISVTGVAVVAVADHQGWQIAQQISAKRHGVRSPDLIDALFQAMSGVIMATGVDVVGSIRHVDLRSRRSCFSAAWNQRFVEVAVKFLEGGWGIPDQLGNPKIHVVGIV